MKNSTLFGGILVAIGAASYGMLTTFVKLAETYGYNMYEITLTEYVIGTPALFLADYLFRRRNPSANAATPAPGTIRKLMLTGVSMGATTFIYYLSVQYISVSIAIVLLMQSVWIGVLFDAVINKVRPDALKIIAVFVVLGGTVLATNLLATEIVLDWRGIVLGFMAAVSYSITIFATNRVGLELSTTSRSKYMALGALILVCIITLPFLIDEFTPDVLYTWGIFFGVFGAFLPPLLLNFGMPKVNLGVGAIITSMELPVAVALAYLILKEEVNLTQITGVVLILIAVIVMNLREIRSS